jgi:hypothetical protein
MRLHIRSTYLRRHAQIWRHQGLPDVMAAGVLFPQVRGSIRALACGNSEWCADESAYKPGCVATGASAELAAGQT